MSDDREHKGPEHILGVLGGWSAGGLAALVPAVIINIKSNVLGALTFFTGQAIGAVMGYKSASEGIKQHNNLTRERDDLESQNKVLTAEKTVLHEKLKWAEKTGKSPDELFADREDNQKGEEKDIGR